MKIVRECNRCEKEYRPWFDETVCGSCSEEIWENPKEVEYVYEESPWLSIGEAFTTGN
jgi:hypothetical protein